MSSCALEADDFVINPVEEEPVRFDVSITISGPIVLERVILVAGRQGISIDEQAEKCLELRHLLAALLCSLYVALELG